MTQPSRNPTARQALIITTSAWKQVSDHLRDVHEEEAPNGILYECGTFEGVGATWKVAIVELGIGNLDSATQTDLATRFLAPDVAFLVGTAFGIGATFGEVVAAVKVEGFGSQDPRKGFEPLPTLEVASSRLEQRARFEAAKGSWLERLNTGTQARLASVAGLATMAGEISSPSAWIKFLPSTQPNVRAVDADIYQVLRVLRALSVDTLVVRGILASISPPEFLPSFEQRRSFAAKYAAAFAFQVLAKLGSAAPQPQRSPRPTESPATQYVVRVAVENIRSITAVDWQIDPSKAAGWHVILGDNGSGKSTFLRALALTLFSRTETDALRQDWTNWLRLDTTEGQATTTLQRTGRVGHTERDSNSAPAQAPQNLETQPAPTDRTVRLSRAPAPDPESDNTAPRPVTCAPELTSSDAFSVAYGPFRRFSGGDLDFEKEFATHPRLTRHLSLFSERAALTEGLAWLKDLRFKQLEERPDGHLLDSVKNFINRSSLLPHGARLAEVSSDAVRFTDGNGCTVPVEELSDGFRSILSLTLDLLRHFAAAFDPADVFSGTDPSRVIAPGVVLVDEMDAHLHPSWQHTVGHWFREHFPNVQFIVATHSPLLCQGADTVFVLPRPGTDDAGRMLTGIELDRVRHGNVLDAYGTGVFGIGVTRSEESKQMLRRLAELNTKELETDLTPEEQSEQDRLRAILPTASRDDRSADMATRNERNVGDEPASPPLGESASPPLGEPSPPPGEPESPPEAP